MGALFAGYAFSGIAYSVVSKFTAMAKPWLRTQ